MRGTICGPWTFPIPVYIVDALELPKFQHFHGFLLFFRLAHRALAASDARSLRSSGVMVSMLRLPPIRPPLMPIFDMILDTAGESLDSSGLFQFSRRSLYHLKSGLVYV